MKLKFSINMQMSLIDKIRNISVEINCIFNSNRSNNNKTNNLLCVYFKIENVCFFIYYPYHNDIYTLGGIVLGSTGWKLTSFPKREFEPRVPST
jgi:hypothetical protein